MKQEDKNLLLKDLSSRLPYGVFCVGTTYELDDDGERYIPVKVKDTLSEVHNYNLETASVRLGLISPCKLETVKPYLRPMSNMTEEEMDKIEELLGNKCIFDFMSNGDVSLHQGNFTQNTLSKLYDFYNSIHVDYRGLIEKGLAIEVTAENNPYE